MQTFLPYPNFEASAKCLDYRRLGKQRVEAWQIYNAISGKTRGWVNHPATVMWRKYKVSLLKYGIAMCEEWIRRGYNDTMLKRFSDELNSLNAVEIKPSWLGVETYHSSHRSNLLRKDFSYYSRFEWKEDATQPYIWFDEENRVRII